MAGKNPVENLPSANLRESELGLQAIVDPYARADFFLSFGEEGVSVEEGFMTFTSLPGQLLRQGRADARRLREDQQPAPPRPPMAGRATADRQPARGRGGLDRNRRFSRAPHPAAGRRLLRADGPGLPRPVGGPLRGPQTRATSPTTATTASSRIFPRRSTWISAPPTRRAPTTRPRTRRSDGRSSRPSTSLCDGSRSGPATTGPPPFAASSSRAGATSRQLRAENRRPGAGFSPASTSSPSAGSSVGGSSPLTGPTMDPGATRARLSS